ncbi:hypothetical protein [Corallococcus exiguus]|uniref:Uncharacterized protein n=1 Tax=Corallococcus exiguus TaxID=83462 RepID=A0A7X4YBV0_9BACT|nr:hypothetical protein [Corallococcus exiguus]NBC41397.1 hypothetical protein [Corallococcus exiguus]TNV53581.1 hypothetical protein FH620_35120 [Corallococcus exiguus]
MTTTNEGAVGAEAITAKWQELGGEAGALGAPQSPTQTSFVGAYRSFDGGAVAWCEQLGAHALYGAISERWLERGVHLGAMPEADQQSTPDGSGAFAPLRIIEHDGGLGEELAVCAATGSGAFEVYGAIWQHWNAAGAAGNPVGFPIDGVGTTVDGVGARQQFEHGWICWHPETGVGTLRESIAQRWSELAYDQYGYPTSDHVALPDGRGEYVTLATLQPDGSSVAGPSIYATPEFGAWEIADEIQTEWRRRGREAGEVGYPIGPPTDRIKAPGREQLFENDRIVWPPDPPGTPRPVFASGPIRSGGLAALGGRVTIQVNPDGSVEWSGHAHNSGSDNYDFSVRAVLRPAKPDAPAIVFNHSGSVYGTFHSGSRDDDWSELHPSVDDDGPALLDMLRGATLETATEYESGIVSTFETVLGWAIKAVVAYTAGTGTLVLVFLGVEVGSLVATGSLLPGAQIINDMYWMAGPFGTLVSLGTRAMIAAGSQETEVTEEQYDWAKSTVFGDSLPPREMLVVTDWSGEKDRAFTFRRFDGKITLNMGRSGFPDPRNYHLGRRKYGETFIHELVHACQAHHDKMGLSYLGKGISACVEGESSYSYPATADFDYTEMGLEAQAQIVSDWFARSALKAGTKKWEPDTEDPFYRYITDNLRMGVF